MTLRTLVIDASNGDALDKSTESAVVAANTMGGPVDILALGSASNHREDALRRLSGVTRVRILPVEGDAPLMAEDLAPELVPLIRDYSHVIAASTSFSKDLLPRLAALTDTQMVSDVVAIEAPDTFVRPIHAGSALATVRVREQHTILSIRPTAFRSRPPGGAEASAEHLPPLRPRYRTRQTSLMINGGNQPKLESASTIVSGGKALGSRENFEILASLAAELNAAVGASRAAVDLGFVTNDLQVGQTGKVVAPDLYIAVGISGAVQHLAGMLGSRVIVAINKDPDAPIFRIADYGLVGDLFDVVPELTRKLAALRAKQCGPLG